jgi:hypothetical protein
MMSLVQWTNGLVKYQEIYHDETEEPTLEFSFHLVNSDREHRQGNPIHGVVIDDDSWENGSA